LSPSSRCTPGSKKALESSSLFANGTSTTSPSTSSTICSKLANPVIAQ